MAFKKVFAIAFCISALCGATASAQLPAGSFGIGADLSQLYSTANILYAATTALQLQAGVGYNYNNYDHEFTSNGAVVGTNENNSSYINLSAGGKYFLKTTGMLPYIGLTGFYNIVPENKITGSNSDIRLYEANSFGGNALFGAQYFIAGPIALYAQFGVGVSIDENTHTVVNKNPVTGVTTSDVNNDKRVSLNFGNTSLGVSFYF